MLLNGDRRQEELKTQADLQGHFNYLHSRSQDREMQLSGQKMVKIETVPLLDHNPDDISNDESS